jgi:hypothetical protein
LKDNCIIEREENEMKKNNPIVESIARALVENMGVSKDTKIVLGKCNNIALIETDNTYFLYERVNVEISSELDSNAITLKLVDVNGTTLMSYTEKLGSDETLVTDLVDKFSKALIDLNEPSRYNKMCNFLHDCYTLSRQNNKNTANKYVKALDKYCAVTATSFGEVLQYIAETADRLYRAHGTQYNKLADEANKLYSRGWGENITGERVALADVATGFSGKQFLSDFNGYKPEYRVNFHSLDIIKGVEKALR